MDQSERTDPHAAPQSMPPNREDNGSGADGQRHARSEDAPFTRRITDHEPSLLVDDILPAGTLIESASVDVLNGYINYVEPKVVITERDPEEDERYISISNQFYTHFHEFGTVIHVIAASAHHYWYFCYDIDASDCTIGRVRREDVPLGRLIAWAYHERVTRRYPILEIDPANLHGFRSFQ